MKSIFGSRVSIHKRDKNKGKIEIEYYSSEELERLFDLTHLLAFHTILQSFVAFAYLFLLSYLLLQTFLESLVKQFQLNNDRNLSLRKSTS